VLGWLTSGRWILERRWRADEAAPDDNAVFILPEHLEGHPAIHVLLAVAHLAVGYGGVPARARRPDKKFHNLGDYAAPTRT
jgi:hypothetical protein